jgi:hypothetical protein
MSDRSSWGRAKLLSEPLNLLAPLADIAHPRHTYIQVKLDRDAIASDWAAVENDLREALGMWLTEEATAQGVDVETLIRCAHARLAESNNTQGDQDDTELAHQ